MTAGQRAYEEDCRHEPTYGDGAARKSWDQLGAVEQWSWQRNPTPRAARQKQAA